MSAPFIIWTLRRTGGTTLTTLMMELSGRPRTQHEPFNWDRCFGHVARNWSETRDAEALERELDAILSAGTLIKHCHELHPDDFNDALFDRAERHGYRHLVLDRRDEVSRILSLQLAKLTGVWGRHGSAEPYARIERGEILLDPIDIPSAVAEMRLCHDRRLKLKARIAAAKNPVRIEIFENLYASIDQGRPRIRMILQDFGMIERMTPALKERINAALKWRAQESARVMDYVPNIAEARAVLAAEAQKLEPVF